MLLLLLLLLLPHLVQQQIARLASCQLRASMVAIRDGARRLQVNSWINNNAGVIRRPQHWSSGRILPCHGRDPGSIPGCCTFAAAHVALSSWCGLVFQMARIMFSGLFSRWLVLRITFSQRHSSLCFRTPKHFLVCIHTVVGRAFFFFVSELNQ